MCMQGVKKRVHAFTLWQEIRYARAYFRAEFFVNIFFSSPLMEWVSANQHPVVICIVKNLGSRSSSSCQSEGSNSEELSEKNKSPFTGPSLFQFDCLKNHVIDELYFVWRRQSTDFEVLKMWNGLSGSVLTEDYTYVNAWKSVDRHILCDSKISTYLGIAAAL